MPAKKTPFSFDSAVSSFISDTAVRKKNPFMIPLAAIVLPDQQPRFYFDAQAMDALVASIRQHGILSPLIVRPLEEGRYELVAGERRYQAAQSVGLIDIPVVIRDLTDEQAYEVALLENLQREDLNPVEETEGILTLLAKKLHQSREQTIALLQKAAHPQRNSGNNVIHSDEWKIVEQVFTSVGKLTPDSFRSNRLPLLKLPKEILNALRQGKIEYTKARAIARLRDDTQRQALLESVLTENLSLSAIRQRVQQLTASSSKQATPKPRALEKRIDTVYDRLKAARVWKDNRKQKRLETLLGELEQLLESKT